MKIYSVQIASYKPQHAAAFRCLLKRCTRKATALITHIYNGQAVIPRESIMIA